ncbi:MAG TPA: Xaa-Pro peptidase family protein [Gaiellaceae bacterium]|nr:Xaa-Pro peptidase family protein [Gaiellaceae bacterium]
MPDVVMYADTFRSPELRHEVALGVPDPFLYVEKDGQKHIMIGSMEIPRLTELAIFELHPPEEFGADELRASGRKPSEINEELRLRALRAFGVESAVVPFGFSLGVADHLRANGIELTVDRDFFDDRRRVKTQYELEGIRRAQAAAEAGMAAAADLLRRAKRSGEVLHLDGDPLTSERLKLAIAQELVAHGATADEFIVAHGGQAAVGHDMGSGPIRPGETVVIDLWPRDNESFCYADMTRTFVVGEPSDEAVEWHRLCTEALDRAVSQIRGGAPGKAIFDATCEIFEAAGYPTQRTKPAGETIADGFFHGLGHGVGLEVHEQPGMGQIADKALKAGDVVTVEPGLYRQGVGGVRLEDLVLVTEDGAENLTSFPYDLSP